MSQFADLIGKPVALRVLVGALRLPLHGQLIAETPQAFQLRVEDRWNLSIDKASVESIERDTAGKHGAR